MNGATLVIVIILTALALSFLLTLGAFYYGAKKRESLPSYNVHPDSPAARRPNVESVTKHSHRKWYMVRDPKIVETPVYAMSGALGGGLGPKRVPTMDIMPWPKRVKTYDEELAIGQNEFLATNKPAPVAKI